jgi:hypothetical protein
MLFLDCLYTDVDLVLDTKKDLSGLLKGAT